MFLFINESWALQWAHHNFKHLLLIIGDNSPDYYDSNCFVCKYYL